MLFRSDGLKLSVSFDRATYIKEAIQMCYQSIILALALVVGIIYLFLGNIRALIVPLVALPVSLISTFLAIYIFDFSINLFTLMALVLAIGIVVDDAIVMLENIVRRIELGDTPLVAAYKGAKQVSFAIIATTVVLAQKMGKTPIVVNDCPGFLVNRVLFPYFGAFDLLLKDGADFQQVDKVMEKFGWPMGPAYLIDVVGIDTGVHGAEVMAEGFPDRMKPDYKGAIEIMYENKRLGQKNDVGFYKYELDRKGKKAKTVDPTAYDLVATMATTEKHEFDPQIGRAHV